MTISKEALDELEKSRPDLVAQYRAKMDPAASNVTTAQDMQDYGSIANGIGKTLTDYGNAKNSDVVLHNRMDKLGAAPTVQAAHKNVYDGSAITQATDRNLTRAKESQTQTEAAFWTEEKLKDRGQALQDSAKVRADQAKREDPNSAESKAAREFLKMQVPSAAKVPNFDNLSEAQVEKISPALFQSYKLQSEERRHGQTMASNRNARADAKAAAKADKQEIYDAETRIDGAEVKEGFRPTKDDAKKAKSAKSAYDKISASLDEMDTLYEQSGTNLVGDDAARMESLRTNILMAQKELDGLGVLSGQDERLTMDQIPDPSSWGENIKGVFGQDRYKAKADQYRTNLNNQYDATLGATGYGRSDPKKKKTAPAGGTHGADLPD